MKELPKFKIDFFCIGAPKSGSTWLSQCLSEHPQITISRRKETNFFARKLSSFGDEDNPKYLIDWRWYKSLFDQAKPNSILGDCSINLMHNTLDAAFNIKKSFPEAKFIVILRNPIKRVYSNFWHEKRYDLKRGMPETFEDALNNSEMLFRSKYYELLSYWLTVFPLGRFFIITDIELLENKDLVLAQLFRFLQVDSTFVPPSANKRVNEAKSANAMIFWGRRIVYWMFRNNLSHLVEYLYKSKIDKILFGIWTKTTPYPPLSKATEARLMEYYLDDINNLERLLNKDLSAWKAIQ